MIPKLVFVLLAFDLCAARAGQIGSVEKLDGTQLRGEIAFEEGKVTLTDQKRQSHTMSISEIRSATFSENAPDQTPGRNGLRGRYYSNIKHDGKPLEQIDPAVDFNWQESPPRKGVTPNGFSIRWEGEVEVPVSGEITFEVESDDGSRLWVNGEKLIDHWQAQSATAHSGKIKLEAKRRYSLRLEYYDAWSMAIVRLRWEAEGLPRSIIPTKHLFPLPLTNPEAKKHPHGVKLRSGSEFVGKIASADSKRVRLETAEGTITIPAPAIGYLRFSPDWGSSLDRQLADRPPGVALMNRDFIEGKFTQHDGSSAKLESLLFGSRSIQTSQLRAIKLADQKKKLSKYLLITATDTFLQIDAITTLPDGRIKVRDGSGYHLTLPEGLVKHLRTTPQRSAVE